MDDFQQVIKDWSAWRAVAQNTTAFTPLIQRIYSSENEPFKAPVAVANPYLAVFTVGTSQIAIFPPSEIATATRDVYQTERFSLIRMARQRVMAPQLMHAGFVFDAYQFYYLIYKPLAGVTLRAFCQTAEPIAKTTLGRQIGTIFNQLAGPVAAFNQRVNTPAADDAWAALAPNLPAERQRWLAAHPVATDCFVHGTLSGDNLIVTSGQVGLQRFERALQGPREVELVALIANVFNWDADLLAGFQATYSGGPLVPALVTGILLSPDGPACWQRLWPQQTSSLAELSAQLKLKLCRKE